MRLFARPFGIGLSKCLFVIQKQKKNYLTGGDENTILWAHTNWIFLPAGSWRFIFFFLFLFSLLLKRLDIERLDLCMCPPFK